MERQIGEQFDYEGVTLEVVESGPCKGCHFFVNGANIYCKGFNGEINGPVSYTHLTLPTICSV